MKMIAPIMIPDDFDDDPEPSKKKMQKIVCPECGKEFEI